MNEELEAIIEGQRAVINSQQESIDNAITMLEELVLEEDANPERVEEIIKVLTYV